MANIGASDYEFIRGLVYDLSRIDLGSDKQELVAARIRKRLRSLGLEDFNQYCHYLRSAGGAEELPTLLDVISTNVTEFFRERQHFEFMERTALPEWSQRQGRRPAGPFRVWSAACSSGEEPYTIAITLAEYARQRPEFTWQVEASDISTRMLKVATQGVYRAERIKLPEPEWLRRYFQRGVGAHEGSCRVKAALRNQVAFHHVNLFGPAYPLRPGLDVIFCRNVMIYFDRATQEHLVSRLTAHLAPGGYLLLGHSESLIGIRHRLATVRPSVFRNPGVGAGVPALAASR